MTRYQRNSKTISGKLHDEMVMMDIDQGKYFSLNETATLIWEMLDVPVTAEEICLRLLEEYDIEYDKCLEEVAGHLDEMIKMGLVSMV